MNSTRREFKAAQNFWKRYEQQIRDTKLLNSLADSKCRLIWNETNNQRKEGHSNIDEHDGFVDERDIPGVLMHKFNSLPGSVLENVQTDSLNHQNVVSGCGRTLTGVKISVKCLERCDGFDAIHSKHRII